MTCWSQRKFAKMADEFHTESGRQNQLFGKSSVKALLRLQPVCGQGVSSGITRLKSVTRFKDDQRSHDVQHGHTQTVHTEWRVRRLRSKDRFQECFEGKLKHAMQAQRGARWEWVVNVMPWSFIPGEWPRYPLYGRLGRPQGRSRRVGRREHLLPPPRIKPRTFQPVTDRYAYYAIQVSGQKCIFVYSEGNSVWEFGTAGFEMRLRPGNVLKPPHIS